MQPVQRDEVLDYPSYEPLREPFRRRIIELKRLRRVQLGSNMTVLFENHDSVLYQIQEMLRTERISREDAVRHEIDTYNELIPGAGELSATLFLEYPEREERERMLAALSGVESKFYVEIGGSRVPFRNETRGVLPDRTTAVQYAKIPVPPGLVETLRAGKSPVFIGVEHPAYTARTELPPRTVEELVQDLA